MDAAGATRPAREDASAPLLQASRVKTQMRIAGMMKGCKLTQRICSRRHLAVPRVELLISLISTESKPAVPPEGAEPALAHDNLTSPFRPA